MAMAAPRMERDNPLTRSTAGLIGIVVLTILVVASLGSIPWTFSPAEAPRQARVVDGELIPPRLGSSVRYNAGDLDATLLPPSWWKHQEDDLNKIDLAATTRATENIRQALLDELNQQRVDEYLAANPGSRDLSGEQISALGLLLGELPADIDVPAPTSEQIEANTRTYLFGTDNQGRDVFVRTLAGGAISIGIGISAAALSVLIGTLYGALAGYVGGFLDAFMMRIVDILYGLPYILLVVLLAVAGDAIVDRYDNHIRITSATDRYAWMFTEAQQIASEENIPVSEDDREALTQQSVSLMENDARLYEDAERSLSALRSSDKLSIREAQAHIRGVQRFTRGFDLIEAEVLARLGGDPDRLADLVNRATDEQGLRIESLSAQTKTLLDVLILLLAIGGVSWLTMARVIRGQVLSLKSQPFMEAARSIGTPVRKQFRWHLLPNLLGPIIVYATLTVPQAVLQESFLSFLGIGVQAPLPSWGNLAAQGLNELNTIRSRWWLLLFPCLMLGITLLALNFVGEGLREAFDPKRARK